MKEVLGKDHPANEVVDFMGTLDGADAAKIRQQLDDLAVVESLGRADGGSLPSMESEGLKDALSQGVSAVVDWVKGFIEGLFGGTGDASKKKPKKEKSDAEKRREFLQNADPETRERLKDLSPDEFMRAMSAIMDEEEELEVE